MSQAIISLLASSKDTFTKAFGSITIDHKYIHQGKFFEGFDKQSIAAAGTYNYEITTPAASVAYIHFRIGHISSSGDKVTIKLYEGSTLTSGSALTMYNHNRNSTITVNSTVKKGVTISDAGTQIDQLFIGGGTGVGATISGMETGAEHEWILKPETTYLLSVENGSTATNIVETNIRFYEEEMGS